MTATTTYDCPRCGTATDAELYGPCGPCRQQLRETMVGPPPQRLRDIRGVMASDKTLFVSCLSCKVDSRKRTKRSDVYADVRVHMEREHGLEVTDEDLAAINFVD